MRTLPDGRISEMWALGLPLGPKLADTFFPPQAGRVVPGTIARLLAERAGPAADYTSPPQVSHMERDHVYQFPTWYGREPAYLPDPGLPSPRAEYCSAHGCPIAPDCEEACYLLQT